MIAFLSAGTSVYIVFDLVRYCLRRESMCTVNIHFGMSDTSLKPIVDIDTTRYQSIRRKFNTSVVTASLTSVFLF